LHELECDYADLVYSIPLFIRKNTWAYKIIHSNAADNLLPSKHEKLFISPLPLPFSKLLRASKTLKPVRQILSVSEVHQIYTELLKRLDRLWRGQSYLYRM
jgi:hypothetical protein